MTISDLSKIYSGRCVLTIDGPGKSICMDGELKDIYDGDGFDVCRIVPGHDVDACSAAFGNFINVFAKTNFADPD